MLVCHSLYQVSFSQRTTIYLYIRFKRHRQICAELYNYHSLIQVFAILIDRHYSKGGSIRIIESDTR